MDLNRVVPLPSTLLHKTSYRYALEYRELANRERNDYIRELKTRIPHNPAFDKESLIRMREHKWLIGVDTILINPLDWKLSDFLIHLLEGADTVCEEVNLKEPLPAVALDLETFGLNSRIRVEGGELMHSNPIVGVCLAVSKKDKEIGYYLPLNHAETKECPNFNQDEMVAFLTKLIDKTYTIYHNARFDREVLALHKVRLNANYCDTMLLAIAVGLRPETKTSVGLKQLAKQELGREMIELQQIMDSKDFIPLVRFEARTIYCYGASDAINTLALFRLFTCTDKYDNPFKTQKLAMLIDQKASDASRAMLRFGLPTDEEASMGLLKTLIRRSILLEEKFSDIIELNIPIGSSEQVGTWLGETMCREFTRKFLKDASEERKKELLTKFNKKLSTDFGLEVKIKELKAGTKIVYNSPDRVLTNLQSIKEEYDWFPEEVAEQIAEVCNLVGDYRTAVHDYGLAVKFAKYARSDDYGICRTGIDLRYLGTITTRFSNGKGKGDHDTVFIKEGKKGYTASYHGSNGVCGYNAQGISRQKFSPTKAKKIVKINPNLQAEWAKLDAEVEEKLRNLILEA